LRAPPSIPRHCGSPVAKPDCSHHRLSVCGAADTEISAAMAPAPKGVVHSGGGGVPRTTAKAISSLPRVLKNLRVLGAAGEKNRALVEARTGNDGAVRVCAHAPLAPSPTASPQL